MGGIRLENVESLYGNRSPLRMEGQCLQRSCKIHNSVWELRTVPERKRDGKCAKGGEIRGQKQCVMYS